jgi:hypothetical protein
MEAIECGRNEMARQFNSKTLKLDSPVSEQYAASVR